MLVVFGRTIAWEFTRGKMGCSDAYIVHGFLKDHGIVPIGRFGEWDYLWSDQALLSGLKGTREIEV